MKRREFLGLAGAIGARRFPALARAAEAPLRAGFAEADITPEIGMEQPGGYGKSYHKSFHDACKVRAAVFDDGSRRAALVGIDAGSVPRSMVLAARKEIEARCGLPGACVMIGASHSHSSGPIGGVEPGQYDHASAFVRELAYRRSTANHAGYVEHVRRQTVDAVCRAFEGRLPAACGAASGWETEVAFNRRFRMKNGLAWTHPRQGNPDIAGVAGPTDPEVGVLGAWDLRSRPMGCVVNFACHATSSPGGISANWIHYLEQAIRGVMGPHYVVVFLQGASGDVVPNDNLSPYRMRSGEEQARWVGGRVGAEALKALVTMPRGGLTPVAAASELLRIGRRRPAAEHLRRSYEIARRNPRESGDDAEWLFAKEIVMLDALIEREPAAEVEVQAVQVGPALYLSNPAELFCALGLELKAGSPFRFTWPVELANGDVGYVPTEEAFGPNGGGYETRLTSYSNLDIGAGRQIVAAGLRLASTMKPGVPPQPPAAAPFRGPWSYGNVPPQLQ